MNDALARFELILKNAPKRLVDISDETAGLKPDPVALVEEGRSRPPDRFRRQQPPAFHPRAVRAAARDPEL
jgi:hypothetical protein